VLLASSAVDPKAPSGALLEAAEAAARAGGAVIARASASRGAGTHDVKGAPGDYVTEVDRESERAVVAVLRDAAPGVAILAEEGGGSHSAERFFAVDPLDGTTNFLHGFPVVGVSVGLVEGGRPVLGVVHAPFLGDTYRGGAGLGAEVERSDGRTEPLRVSRRDPAQAVVGTGFPFRRKDRLPRYGAMLLGCLERFEDLRRPGAASLDLAWVAAGVFDGFFELGLATWDVAAGIALIEAAGGRTSDWEGRPDALSGNILAGPPQVHTELVRLAAETAGRAERPAT
jgi:myo-inositol-1(or 4)-monophosphatase